MTCFTRHQDKWCKSILSKSRCPRVCYRWDTCTYWRLRTERGSTCSSPLGVVFQHEWRHGSPLYLKTFRMIETGGISLWLISLVFASCQKIRNKLQVFIICSSWHPGQHCATSKACVILVHTLIFHIMDALSLSLKRIYGEVVALPPWEYYSFTVLNF